MVSISPVPATAQLAGVTPLAARRPDPASRRASTRPREVPGELSLALPGSGYTLEPSARRSTLRRTWLDTFDWRLYRAGLTLEQVTSRGTAELRLTGRDGTLLAAEQLRAGARGGRVPRWPALLAAVPPGPLAEQLAPVVGVRALLPVVRATSVLREQRVLNSDDKTDRPDHRGPDVGDRGRAPEPPSRAPAALPVRLTVTAVRGYQAQAARLESVLAGLPGVLPPGRTALEAALDAAGRRPGDYTGQIDVELTAGMPAAAAMAVVHVGAARTRCEANVPGTVRDIDTEFLHDLRVAVRRTRSALKLAGHVLPGGAGAAVPAGVQVAGRPDHADPGPGRLPARATRRWRPGWSRPTPATWSRSASTWPGSAPRSQRQLARGLRSARFHAAAPGLAGRAGRRPRSAARRRPTAAQLAARRIAGAHRRVLRRRRAPSPRPRRRRACTTCASAARNCATCWRSSRPCTTPGAALAGRQGAEGAAGLPGRVPGHRGAAGRAARVRRPR